MSQVKTARTVCAHVSGMTAEILPSAKGWFRDLLMVIISSPANTAGATITLHDGSEDRVSVDLPAAEPFVLNFSAPVEQLRAGRPWSLQSSMTPLRGFNVTIQYVERGSKKHGK